MFTIEKSVDSSYDFEMDEEEKLSAIQQPYEDPKRTGTANLDGTINFDDSTQFMKTKQENSTIRRIRINSRIAPPTNS